ncbi:MAG: IclR family transcriptional regulator [Rhodospirillaceae bacterium]|nr:IclR family transcriptional regulator [Rhodospirillaceae bacterium]
MKTSPLFVQSLEKAFRVLDAFDGSERFLGLAEIAARTGLDKSAVQRFAYTLERLGFLDKCPKTRRLALGQKGLDLAFNFLRTHPLVEAATPTLVELRRSCGERVNLSLFDGTTLIYVIRERARREYFYSSLIGRRMPTFCTAGGRAMLACLPEQEAAEIVARSELKPLTARTIIDPAAIMTKIAEARVAGYTVSAEESTIGELTVAAAVRDGDGRPLAAVHIAGSLGDWALDEFERRFAPLAVETALNLGRFESTAPAAAGGMAS